MPAQPPALLPSEYCLCNLDVMCRWHWTNRRAAPGGEGGGGPRVSHIALLNDAWVRIKKPRRDGGWGAAGKY